MQEKMDRMVAKSRKGNVQGQEKQTLINQLKVDLKDERAAHMALQESKTLVDIQWAYELDRLEGVLVKLNEKAETYKMAFQEEETRRVSMVKPLISASNGLPLKQKKRAKAPAPN